MTTLNNVPTYNKFIITLLGTLRSYIELSSRKKLVSFYTLLAGYQNDEGYTSLLFNGH